MILFELLQVAIDVKDGSSLTATSSDWKKFYSFCKKQALLGIGFSALEKIGSCPKNLMLSWYGVVLQIEKRNIEMTKACKEVSEAFGNDGFDSCVLKGQGNFLNYPKEIRNRRQPGDIDLWASPKNGGNAQKKVIGYVKGKGNSQVGPNYLHIDMLWNSNIEIEVHYRPRFLVSPYRNYLIQKWFASRKEACMSNRCQDGFSVPPTSVNVVYQMSHLFSHYFDEGLGMRQLLDYYFVLEKWKDERKEDNVLRILESFGIGKFSAAIMWVLQEVFAMPHEYMICEPDEKEGRILLDEIMQSGNFGQYDTRGADLKNGGTIKHGFWKLKRIMRLVGSYPEMALWEPIFRVWHYGWRKMHIIKK